ncbi:zinc finger MYM-type protein 1-like [Tachysurus ichikawai]
MIKCLGLYPENCRDQAHYNADNMSGRLNSLQAHLNTKSPLIHSTLCTAQRLRLVAVDSGERRRLVDTMIFSLAL